MVNQKYNEAFRGVCFLRIREKNSQSNLVLVAVLVPESKGLQYGRREGKDQEKKESE